ncbi:hypothetical protein ACFQX6_08035 [Streptosporangium lutulentum]
MTSPAPDTITVDRDRLWRSLMDLAEIGAYDDERTGLRGVDRLALTDADAATPSRSSRGWSRPSLAVRIDRMGNVYGRREGTDPTAAPVLTGSHIDSVATADHLTVHPDLTNIVPARAELTVDLRNPDDAQMARAEEALAAFLRDLEKSGRACR